MTTDLSRLDDAVARMARAENVAVFHGWATAGMAGIAEASVHPEVPRVEEFNDYPGRIADAVDLLRRAGVSGPYGLSVWYDRHDAERVHLYLEQSFSFRGPRRRRPWCQPASRALRCRNEKGPGDERRGLMHCLNQRSSVHSRLLTEVLLQHTGAVGVHTEAEGRTRYGRVPRCSGAFCDAGHGVTATGSEFE